MSRFHSYLSNAIHIVDNYNGKEPFGVHLKRFFSTEKKYGSTDRKQIAIICYDYFRVANMLPSVLLPEKMLMAAFICRSVKSPLLQELHPDFNAKITDGVDEKAAYLQVDLDKIFPFTHLLSPEINPHQYSRSFLQQPHFFIRLRPGREKIALKQIKASGLPFVVYSDTTISLPASTQLSGMLKPNKDVVVQDFCSQQVLDYLKTEAKKFDPKNAIRVWDCCAASGGKSILVYDILGKSVQLTVSDIRNPVLKKLKQRLQQANVPIYKIFQADITQPGFSIDEPFQIIIADVPCSGSGTWGRTPEQLHYFPENSIAQLQDTQQSIGVMAANHLEKNGLFFYITCSVFKEENEAVVEYLQSKTELNLLTKKYIPGYDKQADTMFVAVFEKT